MAESLQASAASSTVATIPVLDLGPYRAGVPGALAAVAAPLLPSAETLYWDHTHIRFQGLM
jgi:hypothetical protein